LELIDPPASSATAIARSDLSPDDGARLIRVGLRPAHLLVKRALHRADTLHLRFLVGISLVEYSLFWWRATDGKGVTDALRQAAGYVPGENSWGSAFASRLAISELLLPIDRLPIFDPSPQAGPHILGTIKIVGRSPSDIPRWRIRPDDEPEAGEPIPKRSPKVAAISTFPDYQIRSGNPVRASASPSGTLAEPVPVTTPSFAERFCACAEQMLDPSTYQALIELTGTGETSK
jgi:hypothetical protein